MSKKLTRYVSEIDLLMQQFDRDHPIRSRAQKIEQNKYRRIYALRDQPIPEKVLYPLGEDF